jgi:hypothetical protein
MLLPFRVFTRSFFPKVFRASYNIVIFLFRRVKGSYSSYLVTLRFRGVSRRLPAQVLTIGVTLSGSRGWHRPKLRREENYVACSAC